MITQTRAAAYTRMSTDKQETSPAQQREEIEALAKRKGYSIVEWYSDDGISGDKTEKRFAFQRMIEDAVNGDFSVILCWDQDRFGRFDSMEAGFWCHPLRKSGVRLETVTQGRIDWDDFGGRLVYSVAQEGKQQFLKDLSGAVTRGMKSHAAAGRWMGGRPPLGYVVGEDGRLHLGHPDDIETVRLIFDLFLHHAKSLRAIALELTTRGIESPAGKPWSYTGVKSVLLNRAYLGNLYWSQRSVSKYRKADRDATYLQDEDRWIVAEESHPALIDAETHDRVKAVIAKRRRTHSAPSKSNRYIFSGLLRCGRCGERMRSHKSSDNLLAYRCYGWHVKHSCPHSNFVHQDKILANVVAVIQQQIGGRRDDLAAAMRSQLERDSAAAQVTRDQLAETELKLTKAKRRLLEVDSDMVVIVQDQIREIETTRAYQAAAVAESSGDREAAVAARIDASLKWVDRLDEAFQAADSELVRQVLHESIERVDIWMKCAPLPGRKRNSYTVERGVVLLKTPGETAAKVCTAGAPCVHLSRLIWTGDLTSAA